MNKLNQFVFVLAIFTGVWIVFAVFDIGWGNDVIKVYPASKTTDRKSSDDESIVLPAHLPKSILEYRVLETHVVGNIGGFVTKYEDCEIFDLDNWSCTYSDDSGTFGLRSGDYYFYSNTVKFPHLARYDEDIYLSRFGYIVLGCRWDWTGGPIQMIICLLRPFAT